MNHKSSHHKSENTFRFQTFAERLSGINVDVARRVQKVSATPEDADTFFGEALVKWNELNCTRNFVDFRKEIVGQIQSLNQLIHHQDKIVEVLQRHLAIKDSLASDALLDLVVQLARDLNADFYPYFEGFFKVIVVQLNCRHHDTEFLEQAFTCLAYLFKFLWRSMLRDMHNVYNLFSPLLGDNHREYINNFAAESFAFLIRKVKGHDDLFDFMFSILEKNPDEAAGVGRLLFESVKGVQKQLHSVVDKIIPAVLPKLHNGKLPFDAVCESLSIMWQSMANFCAKQHVLPVWNCLLAEIDSVYKQWEAEPKKKKKELLSNALEHLLVLAQSWVCYKNGILLVSGDDLAQTMIGLYGGEDLLPHSCANVLMQTTGDLLLAPSRSLQPHYRTKLLRLVFQSKYSPDLILTFSKKIFELPLLEKDALTLIVRFCEDNIDGGGNEVVVSVMYVLVGLVLHKAAPPTDCKEDSKLYPLLFNSDKKAKTSNVTTFLRDILEKSAEDLPLAAEDLSMLWSVITVLPHAKPLQEESCVNCLQLIISKCLATLKKNAEHKESLLCIWCAAVISLLQLQDAEDFINSVSHETVIAALIDHPHSVHVLRAAALYFKKVKESEQCGSILTEDTFLDICGPLQLNLSQPYSRVRLLTLQICCQFPYQYMPIPDDVRIEQIGIFQICLAAEEIPTAVHTYREKLVPLHKLEHSIVQNQIPIGPYKKVALHFLIAHLYVNFTLLWEPVMQLIKSYADGLLKEDFWEVYGPHLAQASADIESNIDKSLQAQAVDLDQTIADIEPSSMLELFRHHWDFISMSKDRPDSSNFRYLLWQTMTKFPHLCQASSKQMVPLFFRFLENEYYRADLSAAPTQDLRRKEVDDVLDDDDEEDVDTNEDSKTPDKSGKKRKVKRAPNRVFHAHLKLFSKFTNPMEVTMEPRLRTLYHELLAHRDVSIQKVAFECLLTYKYKYLVPYSENFEKLLDNISFKNEIVLFTIDGEDCVVQNEHRNDMLPILMRILYGKMQTKTGNDTSGKAQSQARKGIVIRFLAGCKPQELSIFLDLAFENFLGYYSENLDLKVKNVIDNMNIGKIVPIRKQQGALNMIEVVLKKLGRQIKDFLPKLVHIIVGILAEAAHLLDNRDKIVLHSINKLKLIRQVALARLKQVFESYRSYPWSEDEVHAVFTAAVWPQLEKLPLDGISYPTALLNILNTWTVYKRYWCLLGKHKPGRTELSALPYVFNLLHSNGLQKSVAKVILSMVENLLLGEDDEDEGEKVPSEEVEEELEEIDVKDMVKLDDKKEHSLGVLLILPHVSSLLKYISGVVAQMNKQTGKNRILPEQELNILATLSQYVTDTEQSAQLVSLLLPFLEHNMNKSQDLEVSLLKSVQNLLKQVPNSAEFMPPMAKLFSSLTARVPRSALCEALLIIGSHDSTCKPVVEIVKKLNAWDRRRMEEPDYDTRLDGFQAAHDLLQAQTSQPNVNLFLMLTHNCCFLLSTTEDMSLRDSSSLCLQRLVNSLAQFTGQKDLFKTVVLQNLLPLVKNGIRHTNEVSRHEYIQLLAHLVKTFPEHHAFRDLAKLRDDEDVEVDFFDNITHIQMHRRARAMKRLVDQLRSHTLSTDCLVTYLIPIVTTFVKDEAYLKDSNLIDGVVYALGGLARCLPWPRYLLLLKHYLQSLPKSNNNQKLMVRIVVVILDNFHYDLCKSQEMDTASMLSSDKGTEPEKSEEKSLEDMTAEELDEHAKSDKGAGKLSLDDSSTGERLVLVVCNSGLATRIHRTILRSILPQLHRCLTQKSKSDDIHRKAEAGKYAEDDEILRVPIALAMIKLLQNLPNKTLQRNLPSVLLKVCLFLKSRANDIRSSARETLVKILQSLGPTYFHFILKEMKSALTRGYQLHVLSFTVYTLLKSLAADLKSGDLDSCIPSLVPCFNEELFGQVAEEKEVDAILGKLPEARTSKSYDSYQILAQFVTKGTLAKIIVPLKEILDGTNSHKVALKVATILRKICEGLVINKGLALSDLLTFTYGVSNEALPMITPKKTSSDEFKPADPRLQPESTYLLKPEPTRGLKKPKYLVKTNMYLIVEFGVQVLNTLLKRSLVVPSNMDHLQMLDPFVATISTCLAAKHAKVTATSLRCLLSLLKFPLPALREKIKAITNSLFVLLSNYASAGAAAKGDNAELLVMCFKAVTVLVRDVDYHTIDEKQLRVLLGYAEQDIHDHTRHATAFPLLRAILTRKLVVPEMHDVMLKVEELSIQADSAEVRLKSRQVILSFLLDYPLGKKLRQHLEFYVSQLDYEHETGRESALEMLATAFATFPQRLLVEYADFFFVPLASRLVNDDSSKCRHKSALAIQSLLSKLDNEQRDKLFSICLQWFRERNMSIRQLAALASGHLVEVESGKFERHLGVLMPILQLQTLPDKYEQAEDDSAVRVADHLLFSVLNLLMKTITACNLMRKEKWADAMTDIMENVESHLVYPYTWVQLLSSQLFGLMFASWTPQEVVDVVNGQVTSGSKAKSVGYLSQDTPAKLHRLCGIFCKQLASPHIDSKLADQLVKNLVFLGRVLCHLPDWRLDTDPDLENVLPKSEEKTNEASLSWIVRRLGREAKMEAANNPKVTIKRSSVFKWLAAVAIELGQKRLPEYISIMLQPVVRELTSQTPNQDAELRTLCQEVVDLMKKTVGVEIFTRHYSALHKQSSEKKIDRKRQRDIEVVNNPELAAKRKIKKNLNKKESKKRKVEELKPARKIKRKKMH
jgi:U3 small nucleolar RNA-associated protein 20